MTEDRSRLASLVERYLAQREQDRMDPGPGAHQPRREDRAQLAMLERVLESLDRALDTAMANRDLPGTGRRLSARVPVWLALADLAEEVHPAYAMACRVAAGWEYAAADQLGSDRPAAERRNVVPGPAAMPLPVRQRPSLGELLVMERCATRGPGWDGTSRPLDL